ncbi:YkgJ family cysteine cluster protein [Candidatus Woesearchaeota archaeon]|nr:YkgJ family cysteine cluster protein [Candidatus Woesearchaeota archaeon]
MIPKFKCQQCGKCCDHIRGKISKEEKEFLKQYAYGKMPLVQLMPVENISFPLWDWEAKRFMKWQKEVNIDAKINPSRAILDLNTNKTIIVTYSMDADSCPFLKDKKCLIYDKKRAYVCRLFPFNKGPFLKTDEAFVKEDMFGTCPALDDILPKLPYDKKDIVKFLSEAFPDGSFLNVVQHDLITEWENKTIIALMKAKKIRPAMNYPYEFLKKRIDNAEKIDFSDFLVESNYTSREEMDRLINHFDNNIEAKGKIKEFIK